MADTKFMSFAEVTPLITDNVLVGNAGNGVRRASLEKIKEVIGATPAGCGGIIDASLGTDNGFVKFANGLLVQWGILTLSDPTAESITHYFPVAFTPNTLPAVVITGNDLPMAVTNIYNDSFFMKHTDPSSTTNKSTWVSWIAIGH